MLRQAIGQTNQSRMTNFQPSRALIEAGRRRIKSPMLRIYTYEKCSTCRNALKFITTRGWKVDVVPIREQPPTKAELKKMLNLVGGEIRRLFNTSGLDYKALGMKDKLPAMSEAEAIDLLSRNGNLVKRPFALSAKGGAVGFKPEEWEKLG
jgi:arsenate reductase